MTTQCWYQSAHSALVFGWMDCYLVEMEEKPYSVDSSDDVNIEEEEEHIEDNHSKCY